MIWIKGFFRKATTKVYFFVLCFLFIGIYLLNAFTNYYTNLLNNVFRESTVLYVVGQNDYYNTILQFVKPFLKKITYNAYEISYTKWQNKK